MLIKLNVIVAACENMGIGYKGDLPWRLKKEMAYFTRLTQETQDSNLKNAVVMGRKTWDSIPAKYKPLKGRVNIVLSRNPMDLSSQYQDSLSFTSWEDVLKHLEQNKDSKYENFWVIGGSHLYKIAMESPLCHRIYLTRVMKIFNCDTFFPPIDHTQFLQVGDPKVPDEIQEENDIRYKFEVYQRKQDS